MPVVFYELVFRWPVTDNEESECRTWDGDDENEMIDLFNEYLRGARMPPERHNMPIMMLRRITQNDDGVSGSVDVLERADLREQDWWNRSLEEQRKWEEFLAGSG